MVLFKQLSKKGIDYDKLETMEYRISQCYCFDCIGIYCTLLRGLKMNKADKIEIECLCWVVLFAASLVSVFIWIACKVL